MMTRWTNWIHVDIIIGLSISIVLGCGHVMPPEPPERPSVANYITGAIPMPDYLDATKGEATALAEGDIAPYDGVLIDEGQAMAVAELRIAYDEVYRLSQIQGAAYGVSLRILEGEIANADAEIARKNNALIEIRDSWWARNKLAVGIITGVVIGVGGGLAAGLVWAKIDN